MKKYNKTDITEFNNILMNKDSSLCGGSATALISSVTTSLIGMMINIIKDKKSVHPEIQLYSNKIEEIKNIFLEIINKDANNYNEIKQAYKNKIEDKDDILVESTETQIALIYNLNQALLILINVEPFVSKTLLSDIGICYSMIFACFNSSFMIILANTKLIKNEDKVKQLNQEVSEILANANIAAKHYSEVAKLMLKDY